MEKQALKSFLLNGPSDNVVAGAREQIQLSTEERNPGPVGLKVSEASRSGFNGLDKTIEPLCWARCDSVIEPVQYVRKMMLNLDRNFLHWLQLTSNCQIIPLIKNTLLIPHTCISKTI
jgi:hypothetical protein